MRDFDLHEATKGPVGYIPGLDGMRTIAVVLVMISHYGFEHSIPGGLGVTIFFFISGMLITNLLIAESTITGRIVLKDFYARRFLRLAPELIVYIAITCGLAWLAGKPVSLLEVSSVLFYFYNYFDMFFSGMRGWVYWGQLWSLSVEEHFYLIYPAIVGFIIRVRRTRSICFILVLTLPLIWRIFIKVHNFPQLYTNHATEARIDAIAYGCLFAFVCRYSFRARALFQTYGHIIASISVVVLGATLIARSEFFRETIRYSIQSCAIFGMFIGVYFGRLKALTLQALEQSYLVWMGRMSYGAYLWHLVPFQILVLAGFAQLEDVPFLARLLIALALSVFTFGLAAASHRFVFRRVAGLRHRFGSHHPR